MGLPGKLASQSGVIFAMRTAGAGMIFLAQAAIARAWGPERLGEFVLIVAAVNLMAVAMPLGFQNIGVYFAAEYRAKGEGRMLRAFLLRCYGHIGLAWLPLLFLGPLVLPLLGEPGVMLGAHWVPAALLALGTTLVFVNGAVLVGFKRPLAGFIADTLFRPMLVVAGFAIGVSLGKPGAGFAQMLWLMGLGYAAVALVHLGYVLALVRQVPAAGEMRPTEWRRWWRFALPWVLISFATDFFFDIDLLMLAHHLSREELAVFGVCTRIFSLVSFGVAAVYAITMPDMFEAEAHRDREGFHRKIGDANFAAAVLSVVLLVGVVIGGPLALMLFGPQFLAGAVPLSILCVALVVRSAFGPASMVLSIHDRPYASLPSVALGLAVLYAGNLVLVPRYGLTGAALAALLAFTLWNGALWLTALRQAGIDVSILPRLRQVIATRGSATRA